MIEMLRRFTRIKLHYQILIAMVLGLVFAVIFGKVAFVDRIAEIFMRLLRMVIVPLVLTSIVHGVAGIGDGKSLGRLGLKTLLYYCTTSLFAILIGLSLSNLMRPGDGLEPPTEVSFETPELQTPGSLGDILVRMIPRNPIQAAAEFVYPAVSHAHSRVEPGHTAGRARAISTSAWTPGLAVRAVACEKVAPSPLLGSVVQLPAPGIDRDLRQIVRHELVQRLRPRPPAAAVALDRARRLDHLFPGLPHRIRT